MLLKKLKINIDINVVFQTTGNISTALMAISKTDILEFHVKINEKGDYPDKSISLNLKDVKFIIKTKNDFLKLNTKVNKNLMFKKLLKN